MMATVVMVACLVGDPQNCRPVRFSAPGCAAAVVAAAEWLTDHPGWRAIWPLRCTV